jgi:hypothetical protein
MAGINNFAGTSGDFIVKAARIWKLFKSGKEKYDTFSSIGDDFDRARKAAAGELEAYTPAVEKVRVYAANQSDKLSELARKDENYWIERSGANLFDPIATAHARTLLDEWIIDFNQVQTVIQGFLPMAQTARELFSNTAVSAVRSAIDESSLPPLDGIALQQVVGDLNSSNRNLDIILRRLHSGRMALR